MSEQYVKESTGLTGKKTWLFDGEMEVFITYIPQDPKNLALLVDLKTQWEIPHCR